MNQASNQASTWKLVARKCVNEGSVNQHHETGRRVENCPEIDFQVQGLPCSTVEQQDSTRKHVVKNLIRQIESHPNREAFKKDLQQNQDYNLFREESKDLIHSMENVRPVCSMSGVLLHEGDRVLQMRILPGTDKENAGKSTRINAEHSKLRDTQRSMLWKAMQNF